MNTHIKYFVTDIDGTLTDGKIYMGPNGETMKAFCIKDGYALSRMLRQAGIEPIVITGRESVIVNRRCAELGIGTVAQGVLDKSAKLAELIESDSLADCAYFGDDIIDLPCMTSIKQAGGIVGCPADAAAEVKAIADYICIRNAGKGAGREFVEWLISDHSDPNEIAHRIEAGIAAIENLVASGSPMGIHRINDWLTVEIKCVETKPADRIDIESHRHHADIQWVIDGDEAIDIAPVAGLSQKRIYDEATDSMLWSPNSPMTRVHLTAGSYVVLYPGDAHRPCIAENGNGKTITVAIGKVRID